MNHWKTVTERQILINTLRDAYFKTVEARNTLQADWDKETANFDSCRYMGERSWIEPYLIEKWLNRYMELDRTVKVLKNQIRRLMTADLNEPHETFAEALHRVRGD